jgi:YegS/Rv2252/BmrU family lipid kinase
MKPSLFLIINPIAGSFDRAAFKEACSLLQEHFVLKEFYTSKRGDAEEIARRIIPEKPSVIAVVGGDGSFNEVVNATAYSGIPLSFIPAGTSNVLAKEFSLPEDNIEASKKIITGQIKELHLGYINNRYFVLMAGVGFDGASVYYLNKKLKRLIGKAAYVLSGLMVFSRYKTERLKIKVDNREYEGTDVIVCNAKKYAGAFSICPDADMTKPALDIFILHGKGRMDVLKVSLGIIRGIPLKLNNVTFVEGRNIYISGNAHVQVDGDYFGRTPVEITIRERALKLII